MPSATRPTIRSRRTAAVLMLVGVPPMAAGALAGALGVGACITAPPPALPQVPSEGPRILDDLVRPPTDEYLRALPDAEFLVPVVVTDPTKLIVGEAFVDFYPGDTPKQTVFLSPVLDGGPTEVSFGLTLVDPGACHIIQFFVSDGLYGPSAHAENDGADSVTWFYAPNGPNGCDEYDAGDGSSETDAPTDGALLTPDGVSPI